MYLIVSILSTTAAWGRDWYFDKNSIGGTCSDTGPGTITQPFCNIFNMLWEKSWNGAAAGDTIYIRQGTYTGRLFWLKSTVLVNGTAEYPITIKPYQGETVIFDGLGADKLFNLYGRTHDLHFIGPFGAKNYMKILDGDKPTQLRTNLIFDGWNVHDGSMGFLLRFVGNTTVKNSIFYNLKGLPSEIDDNVIGISFRGDSSLLSDNVTIENCIAHDINDGKGNDNGDADGFHTDQYINHLTIKNSSAYRCSEDGIDTKARIVLLENVQAYNNGATGIKMWGGNIGLPSIYNMRNALTYGNSETGVKCTGWGDATNNQVTAIVDHLTSWGNGEDGFKLSVATETSQGCNVTLRNSIVGETRDRDVTINTPRLGYGTMMNMSYTNLFHTGAFNTITAPGCSPISSKYTPQQYLDGVYHTDLSTGLSCGSPYGTITGTSTHQSIYNPMLTDAQPKFEWASIAEAAISGNSLILVTESNYPWPSPAIGEYIEVDDDGIKRQVTAVGTATTRLITFIPAVSSQVCGRATDCRGVRVIGWRSNNKTYKNDMSLASDSPAINSGLFINGVHCALADDNGGSVFTGCVHWSGSAPDLGFKEFDLLQSSTLPKPQIKTISPY
jgi:hypothetical protein